MLVLKIFAHPVDEVIFEYTLDELMEDVWGDQLINVCVQEMISEGLENE